MFTIDQIKAAHCKVKSGADFPAYIQEIKQLGVTRYDTFVADGHTDYFGADNLTTRASARYNAMTIAVSANVAQFKADLKAHQQGQTDFPAFIHRCAELGIEKWTVDLHQMTCTYYDRSGHVILIEKIPQ